MTAFGGFPPATTRFLGELRANNRKDWFDAHRADYEAHWVAPAKAFVVAAGQQLAELAPEHLGVGAGCHGLDPERLARFRQAVADPASGAELAGIAQRLEAAGYQLGGAMLKRPPAGFVNGGPGGRFLVHKALFVHHDEPPTSASRPPRSWPSACATGAPWPRCTDGSPTTSRPPERPCPHRQASRGSRTLDRGFRAATQRDRGWRGYLGGSELA
jgi:hypothetical protein